MREQMAFLCALSSAFVLLPAQAWAQDGETVDDEAAPLGSGEAEPVAAPVAVGPAEVGPAEVGPAEVGPTQVRPVAARPVTASDGVRFRGAIAAAGGGEFVSDFAFGMGGLEGRVGVQINNLIGIYVQPSLSFGTGSYAGRTTFTGTAVMSALIDFTIADHFFVAAGGGVGILNNPIGPEIHLRVGGYPAVAIGEDGFSRQGLMLGVDARLFILESGGQTLPVMQLMGSIGYEVF